MSLGNPTCPHCGKVVDAGDEYCLYCGYQLVEGIPTFEKNIGEGREDSDNYLSYLLAYIGKVHVLFLLLFLLLGICGLTLFIASFFLGFDAGSYALMGIGLILLLASLSLFFLAPLLKKGRAKKEKASTFVYEDRLVREKQGKQKKAYPYLACYKARIVKEDAIFFFILNDKKESLIVALGEGERKEFLLSKAYDCGAKEKKQ